MAAVGVRFADAGWNVSSRGASQNACEPTRTMRPSTSPATPPPGTDTKSAGATARPSHGSSPASRTPAAVMWLAERLAGFRSEKEVAAEARKEAEDDAANEAADGAADEAAADAQDDEDEEDDDEEEEDDDEEEDRSASCAATMARPSGCSLHRSTAAASRRRSALSIGASGKMSRSSGRPAVNVPVLSSTTVSMWASCSRVSASRISTPSRAPRPTPTITDIGVANPRAHGQAITSTDTA